MNKYKLYAVLMTITFCLFILPKIWYALTYQKTSGIVDHYTSSNYKDIKSLIPYAKFYVATDSFYAKGSEWENEEYQQGNNAPVIYSASDPRKAYIFTFLGFWMPGLIIFFICFLSFSAVFLGKGILPVQLTLERNNIAV